MLVFLAGLRVFAYPHIEGAVLESHALQSDIDSLVVSRRELYRRQRRGGDVSAEIKEISLALRPIRLELKCCQQVADRIPQIQEHIRLDRQAEEQAEREKTKPRERRHDLWK